MDEDGVAPFKDLYVPDACVRDVRMDARGAVPPRTRTRSACDGLGKKGGHDE